MSPFFSVFRCKLLAFPLIKKFFIPNIPINLLIILMPFFFKKFNQYVLIFNAQPPGIAGWLLVLFPVMLLEEKENTAYHAVVVGLSVASWAEKQILSVNVF
jgi:hypothetical protein